MALRSLTKKILRYQAGFHDQYFIQTLRSSAWFRHFKGKTNYQPHAVLDHYPRKIVKTVEGISQRFPVWIYNVKHANNEVHTYTLPVDSLPKPNHNTFKED